MLFTNKVEDFAQVLVERLRLEEGQNLDLHCVNSEGNTSALEWKDPSGFTVFFNNWQGNTQHQVEEKRFHSVSKLSIHAFPQGCVISCVIHHKALGKRNLTATLHLDHAKQKQKTEETFSVPALSPTKETVTQSSHTTNESNPIFNVTEGNPTTQKPFPSIDTDVWANNKTNMTYGGFVEERDTILFPSLVSLLLLALFIVVILFVMKLRKAHRDWKKENNNASERPIESYRPKAKEAPGRFRQNICVIPWRNSNKYVLRESYTRTPQASEGSQDSSVFEKELSHFKETDM
ncbi:hypothetical protein E2320_007157 [Naja naja]|nr:hypothetical protein E2320_007157 [Naja naja]